MKSRWWRERRIFDVNPLRYSFRRWLWWPLRRIWWSSWQIVLILLVLLFCVGFYGLVVYDATGAAGFGRWLYDLVNIVFAALFALIVGFALFRFQVHVTEREKKQEMMNFLRAELRDLLTELQEDRNPNRKRIFPPKPKEHEVPKEVLEPENYETHFPQRFLYPRFMEQVYESSLFDGFLNTALRDLIKTIYEYDQHAAHLRTLAISHDGSEESRARYRTYSLRVLRQERKVSEVTRSALSRLDEEELP